MQWIGERIQPPDLESKEAVKTENKTVVRRHSRSPCWQGRGMGLTECSFYKASFVQMFLTRTHWVMKWKKLESISTEPEGLAKQRRGRQKPQWTPPIWSDWKLSVQKRDLCSPNLQLWYKEVDTTCQKTGKIHHHGTAVCWIEMTWYISFLPKFEEIAVPLTRHRAARRALRKKEWQTARRVPSEKNHVLIFA